MPTDRPNNSGGGRSERDGAPVARGGEDRAVHCLDVAGGVGRHAAPRLFAPGSRFTAMEGGEILKGHLDGCQVSFLFRGKDVKQHYAAHDALSGAAAQAAQLVAKLKAWGMPVRQLIYEFDKEVLLWFPSYAVLNDNRIITDNGALIAIEQLPKDLSLGPSRGESPSAVVRSVLVEDDE